MLLTFAEFKTLEEANETLKFVKDKLRGLYNSKNDLEQSLKTVPARERASIRSQIQNIQDQIRTTEKEFLDAKLNITRIVLYQNKLNDARNKDKEKQEIAKLTDKAADARIGFYGEELDEYKEEAKKDLKNFFDAMTEEIKLANDDEQEAVKEDSKEELAQLKEQLIADKEQLNEYERQAKIANTFNEFTDLANEHAKAYRKLQKDIAEYKRKADGKDLADIDEILSNIETPALLGQVWARKDQERLSKFKREYKQYYLLKLKYENDELSDSEEDRYQRVKENIDAQILALGDDAQTAIEEVEEHLNIKLEKDLVKNRFDELNSLYLQWENANEDGLPKAKSLRRQIKSLITKIDIKYLSEAQQRQLDLISDDVNAKYDTRFKDLSDDLSFERANNVMQKLYNIAEGYKDELYITSDLNDKLRDSDQGLDYEDLDRGLSLEDNNDSMLINQKLAKQLLDKLSGKKPFDVETSNTYNTSKNVLRYSRKRGQAQKR